MKGLKRKCSASYNKGSVQYNVYSKILKQQNYSVYNEVEILSYNVPELPINPTLDYCQFCKNNCGNYDTIHYINSFSTYEGNVFRRLPFCDDCHTKIRLLFTMYK